MRALPYEEKVDPISPALGTVLSLNFVLPGPPKA
jgi:hypothetical protein